MKRNHSSLSSSSSDDDNICMRRMQVMKKPKKDLPKNNQVTMPQNAIMLNSIRR
jgi:hypothetical protein